MSSKRRRKNRSEVIVKPDDAHSGGWVATVSAERRSPDKARLRELHDLKQQAHNALGKAHLINDPDVIAEAEAAHQKAASDLHAERLRHNH